MAERMPLYAALSNLKLGEDAVDLGKGVVISRTFVHVFSYAMMAFNRPAPGKAHPGPWQATSSGYGHDAEAQLVIPETYSFGDLEPLEIARTIVVLLRLWCSPEITMTVVSRKPFDELPQLPPSSSPVAYAIEVHARYFGLALIDDSNVLSSLDWVRQHWEHALELMPRAEFRLAMAVFEEGQFIRSGAMVLVSLWGALEALFSPSTSELRFRVSALMAAYLEPPGLERLELQDKIAKLYDLRSAAAHGKPKHDNDDLLKTFELLRRVLIKMIRLKQVPRKDDLNAMLLGGRWQA